MKPCVIDTNVLVVANNVTGVPLKCVKACSDALIEARNGLLVLDDRFLILKEYKNNVRESGGPGIGDAFLRWLLQNRKNAERIEYVPITPNEERGFAEFPDDPDLANFDPSDRKFVAVARTSQSQPEIWNAVDTDWWHFREPLQSHGVAVQFLCEDEMQKTEK